VRNLIVLAFLLFSMSSTVAQASEFTAENLAGEYNLTHSLVKDKHVSLFLTPEQTFDVAIVKKGVRGESCSGTYQLDTYVDYPDGPPVEVTTVSGDCHVRDKHGEIVVYLKNITLRDLRKGTYVTLDIQADGKTMNGVMVKIKKQ
jgi:hypothetical protein